MADQAAAVPANGGRGPMRTRSVELRRIRLRWGRLRQRALFLLGGCIVGLAGVVMAVGAEAAHDQFHRLLAAQPLAPLLVTPAGFVLIAWLTRRVFPNAEGSGIPQAIAARKLWSTSERSKLVSIRIGVGKIGLTLLGLLFGAS